MLGVDVLFGENILKLCHHRPVPTDEALLMASQLHGAWSLAPNIRFLNHGSFGATPKAVLQVQRQWQDAMEANPVKFFTRDLEPALDQVRASLAAFLGCEAEGIAFVNNATSGVNTVLASCNLEAGDEVIITNHGYNACNNAARRHAARLGAKVVTAAVPFPISGPQEVVTAIAAAITPRTRLLLVDHVTSPTGLIFPVEELIQLAHKAGIKIIVDGAHGPGMLEFALDALGADYYTGNCHKWLCAPKGSAFLYVNREHRASMVPLVTSHGANSERQGRSRYRLEFDWTGTQDYSPWLAIPAAIKFLQECLPGGLAAVIQHNHQLALGAASILKQELGWNLGAPASMIGPMAAFLLPEGAFARLFPRGFSDAASSILAEQYNFELPVFPWPAPPQAILRITAQLYNDIEEYRELAQVLKLLIQS